MQSFNLSCHAYLNVSLFKIIPMLVALWLVVELENFGVPKTRKNTFKLGRILNLRLISRKFEKICGGKILKIKI